MRYSSGAQRTPIRVCIVTVKGRKHQGTSPDVFYGVFTDENTARQTILASAYKPGTSKYRYRAYLLSSNGMSLPMPLGGVSKRECLENAKRFLQNLDAGKYSR